MPSNELHTLCKSSEPTPAKLTEILSREPKLGEETDEDSNTAFHILCYKTNITLEMIELYLKHAPRAAELVNKHGSTAIYYLCKNNKKIFLHYIEKIF